MGKYEDMIKRLRDDAAWKNCDFDFIYGWMHEAADAIEVLSKMEKTTQWIPVMERLPEDLARVIVFCNDGVFFGFFEHLIVDDEEVVEWNNFLHYPITPTHWMPLPEPPKEE